jgi:hypothetical protein
VFGPAHFPAPGPWAARWSLFWQFEALKSRARASGAFWECTQRHKGL